MGSKFKIDDYYSAPDPDKYVKDFNKKLLSAQSVTTNPTTIGDFYNKSSWGDLNDFNVSGAFSIVSGKIQTPSQAAQAGYLELDIPTSISNFEYHMKYKALTAPSGGNYGVMFKVHSMCSTGFTPTLYAYLNTNSADGNYKKLVLADGVNAEATSPTAFTSISIGDIIDIYLNVANSVWTFTAIKGAETLVATRAMGLGTADIYTRNISRFRVLTDVMTWEIQQLQFSSQYKRFYPRAAIGDSLTWGKAAATDAGKWAVLSDMQILAGNGEATADVLARINEIIAVRPLKAFIMIGTNDINIGVAAATWKLNMSKIDKLLTQAGISVVWINPPPLNTKDMLQVRTYQNLVFAGRTIDGYTLLNDTGGTPGNILPAYNAGDNVHLNAAGNLALSNIVKASPLY